jgi:DNA mismatch repair protein MSH2
LKTIAGKLQESKDALDDMQEEVASDLGMEATGKKKSPLNFENHQVFGHCFRLTRKVQMPFYALSVASR